jgi:hypothetical protein
MILVALSLIFSLLAVLAATGPTAVTAISAGRSDLESVAIRATTQGTLATWFEGDWVDSVAAAPPGVRLPFAPLLLPGGAVAERTLEGILPSVWLLEVRVVATDRGGRVRAAGRQGWLVTIRRIPGDSVSFRGVISRYWVDGFQ